MLTRSRRSPFHPAARLLPLLAAAFLLAACAGGRAPAGGTGPFVGRTAIFQAHRTELNNAGEDYRCEEAARKARRELARDERVSDADLRDELEAAGSLPAADARYGSPGAACLSAGYREALRGALQDRLRKKK